MKHVALIGAAALLVAFQSWPPGARIHSGGRELCAKHHIPLVTKSGYEAERALMVHHHPGDQFEKIDAQTPNRIPDTQSLKREKNISKPAKVTYCPKCEAEFEELWWGRPVSPVQLVGRWRAPNGFSILFSRDGSCSGMAYDGKPFTGRWQILHHGLLRTDVKGDTDPMFFTILSINPQRLTIRATEIGKKNPQWVRVS